MVAETQELGVIGQFFFVFFWIYWKIWSIIFLSYNIIFILVAIFLHKSHIWEKPCYWGIGQTALGQSEWRIFQSNVSPEQNYEIAWFFACLCKYMEMKSWLKNTTEGVVKNEFNHPGYRTLKLAVSQEINVINWFLGGNGQK